MKAALSAHDLVDRFRLDHPGREMWTWLDSSPSAKVGSYSDRVLVKRADIDFVSCPTFHLIVRTDHKLVRVSLQLANRLSRRLSLKGRVEVSAVYVFPLILYRFTVLPLPKAHRLALQRSLSRLLGGGARPMVRRQVCVQHTCNGILGMPDLESHWLAE